MCAAQASLGIERQATWIIAENWWLVALRGVASILFGALAIAWPGLTLLVLVWLFGIYAATDGVFNIISGIRGLRKRRRDSILVLLGAAGIAAGITAIVWPEMTALLLVVLIGAWAMVTGVLEVAAAVRRHGEGGARWLLMLAGLGSVVFGILVVLLPGAGALAAHANGDLLQLTALLIALGAAHVAHLAGLSPAIGAFLAGMLISESDARHVVEREIRPFRDLLVGIFFVSVGTQIELLRVADAPWQVFGWLLVVVAMKFVVVAIIVRLSGEPPAVAVRAAAILAHGGEFGLLLVSLGLKQGLLDPAIAQPLFIALGISIFVAPLLIRLNAPIAATLAGWRRR